MPLILGLPPSVVDLVNKGVVERTFLESLMPSFQFRMEASKSKWGNEQGNEAFITRPSLLEPVTKPIIPGTDPTPKMVLYEQFRVKIDQYADSLNTHMPTSALASTNLLLGNINRLGLQAGQSLNRISRNRMFKAYLSGRTVTTAPINAADTSLQVAAINGFTDVLALSSSARPMPVSMATPATVTIGVGGGATTAQVIGYTPSNPLDPWGPGILHLAAAVGLAYPARTPIVASDAPDIMRVGGGASDDALTPADILNLQSIINAESLLRTNNVPTHPDGFYHAHISPISNSQVFSDPAWQRLFQGKPESVQYTQGFIGRISRVLFYENTEVPNVHNSGATTATGINALYSEDIGSETVNDSGIDIGRIVITGKGALYERYLDESAFKSQAGVQGKISNVNVSANGAQIDTQNVRLILRAPQDALQQMVTASWSYSGDFPVPSDIGGNSSSSRFKRAVVISHAL